MANIEFDDHLLYNHLELEKDTTTGLVVCSKGLLDWVCEGLRVSE